MKVLITGNMGYVGSALVRFLRREVPAIQCAGFDAGYFGHSLTGAGSLPEVGLLRQHLGDVRDFPQSVLEGVDAIVHLAAVSNDPMGKEFESVTDQINRVATVRIAEMAARCGVKNFVFASSCSMYGSSDDRPRRETDPTNPLTAYAISKIGAEHDLRAADLGGMVFTSLRFATACGMSDRLRLDLVLNDFVAGAITGGKITVLSDGTPWRPLIDVQDMARAMYWALTRTRENGGEWLAVNAGRSENNYQVSELAYAVARKVPGTQVSINADAPSDKRSYRVDFSLFASLARAYLPRIGLEESIDRLVMGLQRMKFVDQDFRNSNYMRLNTLRHHIAGGQLSADLRWI